MVNGNVIAAELLCQQPLPRFCYCLGLLERVLDGIQLKILSPPTNTKFLVSLLLKIQNHFMLVTDPKFFQTRRDNEM